MWNGILAAVISVLQIAALLMIKKQYREQIKDEQTLKKWFLYGTAFLLTCLLNVLLLMQPDYNWLMILNFVAASTVVLIAGVIDFHCHKIPNFILAVGAGCRILFLILSVILYRTEAVTDLVMSLVGCVASLLVMLLISILSRQGIGYGDVKLYACLGLYLGLMDTYYILFYAVFLAALYAAYVLLAKKGDRKTKIPFGPFTYLGFVLVYLFSFM